ncbi:unnamed protein product [Didymodactylos carnosus]|uniref:Thioredoxin domain-containing protein n=1 Tax=Didymodactylos carnosus TaxID=1234261 RepID=A0A815FT97_9BILA|nr:unnamed protein product [Didymodactylos carnosus]CAF1330682.1 unnamed protein product [Didymodactylos carnosus]CAF3988074.1 unnamed protein product [Didymodactylos carnosus]CAF4184079.1 unnamed protein product [Didymodactylos carnosus]
MRSTYHGMRFMFTLARTPKEEIVQSKLSQSISNHLVPHHTQLLLNNSQKHLKFHTTAQLKSADIFHVQDDDDFQKQIIDSKKPFIVDFHATWCNPCKILQPRLEKVITSYNKDIKQSKGEQQVTFELSAKFDIQAVPTVLGIKNGKVVDRFSGVVDEDKILTMLDKLNK